MLVSLAHLVVKLGQAIGRLSGTARPSPVWIGQEVRLSSIERRQRGFPKASAERRLAVRWSAMPGAVRPKQFATQPARALVEEAAQAVPPTPGPGLAGRHRRRSQPGLSLDLRLEWAQPFPRAPAIAQEREGWLPKDLLGISLLDSVSLVLPALPLDWPDLGLG